jgi:hydroxymethylbilane synthase
MPALRLGTRASALARWQADFVAAELAKHGIEATQVLISTTGDRQPTDPVAAIGVGAFTKELQQALLDGRIDAAVHSLKDLPTDEVPGLALAAVLPRASVADVLVCKQYPRFEELPRGAVIGTGSLRRRAQLWHARLDLTMAEIRGNVDTRIRKLEEGEFTAIVLAEAGLRRLGLDQHITQILPPSIMLPAPGQGAIGLEIRADDEVTRAAVRSIDDPVTHASVIAERALLAALRGGCLAPIAAWARIDVEGKLKLSGRVLSADGQQRLDDEAGGELADAEWIGQNVATELISRGAAELIRAARRA